jgi:collagenase-like PrtC family protease
MSSDAVELLAPARDEGCGRAAIDAGADAVYIGPERFGAREKAGNSLASIEALCRYAHRYRARVYATVNTLLHDRELPLAETLIRQLWDLGIDAVIVQDLGLLELGLPPVPLFASTQLDCTDGAKARFLEELGFARVILARELSLLELQEIRAATTVPLEVFVHGALCVSYSGRCSASFALGGRSANRGACAQPCRLPWTLRDGAGRVLAERRHLLSSRDMDRSAWLGELVDVGVGSLKIEGRLKDERYARNVVGHYRRALDAVLEARGRPKASSGRVELGFEPDPSRTFSRGSTAYFLHGREAEMSTPHSPKSTGAPIGEVSRIRGRWVELDGGHDLQPGDGLCFVGDDGVFRGVAVTRVRGDAFQPAELNGLAPGIALSRNRDRGFEKALDAAVTQRRVGLALTLRARGGVALLRALDEDGVSVELPLPAGEPARDPERAAAVARAQLGKLGEVELELRSFEAEADALPHLRRSDWNELRRALVEALRAARREAFPRRTVHRSRAALQAPWASLDFRANIINQRSRALLERCGVASIEPGVEAGASLAGRPVMTTRFCLRYELACCPMEHGGRPTDPWTLEAPDGRCLELRFDCARCEMAVLAPSGG